MRFSSSLPEALVFENQMAEGRVRAGHMIEPMHLAHALLEGAARNQPHDHLDSLRAGLTHIFYERNRAGGLAIGTQTVEETRIPLLVDESGPAALQLMR